MGVPMGIAVAAGLRSAANVNAQGTSPLIKLAEKIDKIPGLKQASDFVEERILPRIKGDMADRVLGRVSPEVMESQLVQEMIKGRGETIQEAFRTRIGASGTMEGAQKAIQEILDDPIQRLARPTTSQGLTRGEFLVAAKKGLQKHPDVPADLMRRLGKETTVEGMQKIMAELAAKQLPEAEIKVLKGMQSTLKSQIDNLLPVYKSHQAMMSHLPGQAQELGRRMPELQKAVSKTQADELAAATTLRQVKQILGTAADKPAVRKIIGEIEERSVGPLGRSIVSGGQTLNRIFSGDTIREAGFLGKGKSAKVAGEGAEAAVKGGGKFLGPALMGALMMGTSATSAIKAEKGEKTKTFMHDFLGIGLGGFLGWEVGRKAIRASGIMPKLTKFLPFLGKTLPKFLPFISRFSWAGVITELVAMFILAKPFEKAGEKVADTLFGKPKKIAEEEAEKHAAKQQAASAPTQPGNGSLQPGSRGVFDQFTNPQAGAAGGQSGITLSPDAIRNNPIREQDNAEGAAMSAMPNFSVDGSGGGVGGSWNMNNIFQPNTGH